jgi:hypothetical protein
VIVKNANSQRSKQNILAVLDELPPESLTIVEQFVNFLKAQLIKGQTQQNEEQTSGLGGLWQKVDFDVSVKDIRRLRHKVTLAVHDGTERYDLTS